MIAMTTSGELRKGVKATGAREIGVAFDLARFGGEIGNNPKGVPDMGAHIGVTVRDTAKAVSCPIESCGFPESALV